MGKLRDWIQDWILGNDPCKECRFLYRDSFGDMCEISLWKKMMRRDPDTHKAICNLPKGG